MKSVLLAILVTLAASAGTMLFCAGGAEAQDSILLGEVLPALADTQLGRIEVGPAPRPGSYRMVRRSEIIGALRDAGRSAEGLAIPRSVRVSRESRTLARGAAQDLALPAVRQAFAPCQVESVRIPHDLTVSTGEVSVRAEGEPPQRGGSATAVVTFVSRGSEVRVPVRARLTCPPPAITAGDSVQLVVQIGNVRATASGEARQPGRIGQIIAVTNTSTRAALEGRVVNAHTVEVVQ